MEQARQAVAQLTLRRIESTIALREAARAWDDLWQRSEAHLPVARAELVAQWLDHFAPAARVACLVVEQEGRYLAALPLYGRKRSRLVPVGAQPGNDWSPDGDLLVDAEMAAPALDLLVGGLDSLGWPLIMLDGAPLDSAPWQAFLAALQRARFQFVAEPICRVDCVEIAHDWTAYYAGLSRNHRRHMQVAARRAADAGGVSLRIHEEPPVEAVASLLRRGFEVEDRGWKSAAGTSALRSPGVFDFYRRQAELLAADGRLLLAFLEYRGEPIAFEYGWTSKGVYFTPKVGYDENFGRLSPGQLLRRLLLEAFQSDPARRRVDFLGPASDATSKWATSDYAISRLTIAARGPLGRLLMHAYRHWRPRRDPEKARPELLVGSRESRGHEVEREAGV